MKITDELLEEIYEHPHILGHILGMDLLTEMHSDWIKWVWLSEKTRILMAHRGAYKTVGCVELGIVWWLLFNPNTTMVLARQNYTAAAEGLNAIAKHFRNPILKAIFKHAHKVEPKILSDAKGLLDLSFQNRINKEPTIIAQGIKSIRTGMHVSLAVCDDVVAREDRVSRASREATKAGMHELLANIVNPNPITKKRKGVIVGTPWSPEDWYAEAETERGIETVKINVYDSGLLDEEQIQECRDSTTPSLFAANYELRHAADEDMIFKDPKYAKWKLAVKGVVAHIDPAYGGEDTGALTLMAKLPDGKIQVKGWVFKEHVKLKQSWIKSVCQKYKVTRVYVETNGDNGFLADSLAANNEHGPGLHVFPYREHMNKFQKISQYGMELWSKFVFCKEMPGQAVTGTALNCPNYMEQVLGYTEITKLYDDAPDSLASLVREHFSAKAISQSTRALYGG